MGECRGGRDRPKGRGEEDREDGEGEVADRKRGEVKG
jgi:hypothetical protein